MTYPDDVAFNTLKKALMQYVNKYGDEFIFVSLMRDNLYDEELIRFCDDYGVRLYHNRNLMITHNLINGKGHFNSKRNESLGKYLAAI